MFKTTDFNVQKFKRLLVLDGVFDIVVLVFLVGLLGHQLGDEFGELAFDGRRALVVELVVAEVDEQACEEIVFVADSQAQILGYRVGHLFRVDADGVLVGQAQVVCKASRQLLHKGIDGAHAEAAVIVHDAGHQALGVAFQCLVADSQLFHQDSLHRFGVKFLAVNDFAKRIHDFSLHLIGRGIGEGDGQDVPEIGDCALVFKA